MTCVRFARNSSSFLAAASLNGSITVYFFGDNTRELVLKGHNGPLTDIDISHSDEASYYTFLAASVMKGSNQNSSFLL